MKVLIKGLNPVSKTWKYLHVPCDRLSYRQNKFVFSSKKDAKEYVKQCKFNKNKFEYKELVYESFKTWANNFRAMYRFYRDFKFWADKNAIKGQAFFNNEPYGRIFIFNVNKEIATPE